MTGIFGEEGPVAGRVEASIITAAAKITIIPGSVPGTLTVAMDPAIPVYAMADANPAVTARNASVFEKE